MNMCISGHAASNSQGNQGNTWARCSAIRTKAPMRAKTSNTNFTRGRQALSSCRASSGIVELLVDRLRLPRLRGRRASEQVIQTGKRCGDRKTHDGGADQPVDELGESQRPAAWWLQQRKVQAMEPCIEEADRAVGKQHDGERTGAIDHRERHRRR